MKKQIATKAGLQKVPLLVLLLFFAIQSHAAPFITTWKTDNPGTSGPNQILLPASNGNSNYTIEWEEVGNPSNKGSLTGNGPTTVTFPSPGTYEVRIFPVQLFYFLNGTGDPLKLLTVEQWGNSNWQDMGSTFDGCANMTYNATDKPNLTSAISMERTFRNCTNFNGNIGGWNTSTITRMAETFDGATSFNQNIGGWNTSNVTFMNEMFINASSFNQNIGGWNTSNVFYMEGMFSGATSFNQDIGNWDTHRVIYMDRMFDGASSFNQDIGDWDTGMVVSMEDMFKFATSFNQNIGGWNTGNVNNMSGMFNEAHVFNQDIGGWNTGNVEDMRFMFNEAYVFNQDIGSWNTAKVVDFNSMFSVAEAFNQDIGGWNTGSAEDMQWMFSYASAFNQDISGWNVSNVSDMNHMFLFASSFNQDLGSWTLNNQVDLNDMFRFCSMDCSHYDNTLIGWNANPATPNGLSLDNVGGLKYWNAEAARNNLINVKGWIMYGDELFNCYCAPPPFSACPGAPVTVNTLSNQCYAPASYAVTASGNPAPTLTYTFTGATSGSGNGTGSGSNFNKGNTTVSVKADLACGASSNCVFTVTVKDATKPSITCPANTTITANASCSGTIGAYTAVSVSDNCTANPTVTQSPAPSTVLSGHNNSKTVTLTADDGNGNTQACSFSVTLKDQTKPSITCPGNAIVAANASCSGVVGAYTPASLSDNCAANPTVTQSPAFSTVLTGHNNSKTVTLTADDGNGNTQACTFTVTLKDQTKPSITCPGNAIIVTGASCGGVLGAYAATAVSDNCAANPTVTQSPASGTVLNGHNDAETVTLTADDGNGNAQSCTFSVTLKDQTKPSITCPSNTIVAANASCGGVVGAYSPASLSDNCAANPAVTQSPVTSTAFSGLNEVKTVTLTADDGNGNTQACTFTVTLKDQTKPSITCPGNAIIVTGASCSGVLGAYAATAVSDNCSANPTVTQSPASGTSLSGHNDSKTVTLTADDGNGNTQACSFSVTLKDQTAPTLTCKPAMANLNAAGTASIVASSVYQSGSDNCGVVNIVSVTPNTFNCSNVGANTVTLSGNDGYGNNGTCTAIVTVVDQILPTMLCKNASLALDANGNATLTVAQVNNGSYDNCSLTLDLSQTVFTCANIGANNVTLSGRDQSNNRSQCTAVVTVLDPIKPVAKCKDLTANLGANGSVLLDPNWANNGSSDNCSFALSLTPSLFNCSNLGLNTVTLKATDAGGNTATCTARVTVRDVTGPAAKCKNPTIYLDDSGHATFSAAQADNGSWDNCGMGSMSVNKTAFDCSNIGSTYSVTLSMTDVNGNSASCTSNVTVRDAMAPTAVCEDVSVQLGSNGTVVVYGADLASYSYDNCSVYSYSPIAKVYTAANMGANNLTISAKDWSGNAATCVSVVTVLPFNGDFQQGGGGKHGNNGVFDFSLFPNPSAGEVTMAFELPAEQAFSFRVFDLAGRMLYSQEGLGVEGENVLPLRLERLQPAVYMVDFRSGDMIRQERLVLHR